MLTERGTLNLSQIHAFILWLRLPLLSCVLLSGCQSPPHRAPVDQLEQPPSIRLQHHTVSRGDTLYSIAWRCGMDYRQLADLNGITSPYVIRVGQKLRTTNGETAVTALTPVGSPATQVIAVPDSSAGVTVVGDNSAGHSVTSVTESARERQPGFAQTESVKPEVEPVVKPAKQAAVAGGKAWRWPAAGKVLVQFSGNDPLRKGIDIDGRLGESVSAAAAGNVVYAGSGLAGYGELIIIKHDDEFLSAYAHNSRLLIREGELVKAGQKIAEIGSSGTDRNMLHFEIRRAGKPVDPLQYLPRR
jgi:lipoprotein NlpD